MGKRSASPSSPSTPKIQVDPHLVRGKYEFRWEVLDVIIGGKSLIDLNFGLTGIPMRNDQDVDRFMNSYGFDLENPIEGAEVVGHFHEALAFVRRYFMKPENPDGIDAEIPRKIAELTDIRHLLLMASMAYPGQLRDRGGLSLQNWACSLLKVIHTIAHIDKDVRNGYFGDIQKQILDRFYRVIQRDSNDELFLGGNEDDPLKVRLVDFQTKPKKARDSLLLKLLHKSDSVSEDVFDQVGVRFVTQTRLDALRTVKFLKDEMIVMPANIKPSRSKNTLIDLKQVQATLEDVLHLVDRSEISEEEVRSRLDRAAVSIAENEEEKVNPHSSEGYRSLQFTARQLIKLRNPLYEEVQSLKSFHRANESAIPEEAAKLIDRMNLKNLKKEIRFFYPYEVQILDEVSAEENEKGSSAHSEYKKAQIQTAMRRVMGQLLDESSN